MSSLQSCNKGRCCRNTIAWQLHLLGLVVFGGCIGQQRNAYVAPPPPDVTVATPVEQEVLETKEYTGTTKAFEAVEIHARVEGFLESIEFRDGENVNEGQLLARIDARPYQATLEQAKASLALAQARLLSARASTESAKAELANRKAELERAQTAEQRSPGAVTQSEIDLLSTQVMTAAAAVESAEAAITSAQAEIQAAEAEMTKADLNLSYTEVHSPISGRIGQKNFDVGSLVGTNGATLLTTVVRYDPIYAYFSISEPDFLRFNRERIAQEGELPNSEGAVERPIQLGLGDEEGYPHEGVYDYGDITLDETTGTFMARGRFENKNRLIPPGAFVRIQVPLKKRKALLVDETAVCRDQLGTYLLVVNDQQVVETRRVTLGGKIDGRSIVRDGELRADDRVVVHGLQMSRPGAKVNPIEQGKTPPTDGEAASP